ncbi:hypothetical protein [Natrinema gelatinilyticum]|uniref:hypothetical protein n=1 Tax=Natrinema gelatinilyticum TaxID=2961571 RepID=UPI0020C257A7|nr:hypothetical protein [Natrinema gelatinilyticum]
MSETSAFDSISRTDTVVLLGVAALAREDETPVQTHDLRKHCQQHLSTVETEVVGTITEADVTRSLYQLEEVGLVDENEPTATSPTGKGRPAYTLTVSPDVVYEEVDDDLVDGSSE